MDHLREGVRQLAAQAGEAAAELAARPDLLVSGVALLAAIAVLYILFDTLAYAAIPSLDVPLKQQELAEELDAPEYSPPKTLPKDKIPCYDPGTMQFLGHAKAMTPAEVRDSWWQRATPALTRCAPATAAQAACLAALCMRSAATTPVKPPPNNTACACRWRRPSMRRGRLPRWVGLTSVDRRPQPAPCGSHGV